MSEWISVDEKLPDEGWYLTAGTYSSGKPSMVEQLYYDSENDEWLASGAGKVIHMKYVLKVTHWMPLPDPPGDSA